MNRRTVDTRLSSAPTHFKREPGNEATGITRLKFCVRHKHSVTCGLFRADRSPIFIRLHFSYATNVKTIVGVASKTMVVHCILNTIRPSVNV